MKRFSRLYIVQRLTILVPPLALTGPAALDVALSLVAAIFLVDRLLRRDGQWLRQRWIQVALVIWLGMCLRNSFLPNGLSELLDSLALLRYPVFAAALAEWVLHDTAIRRHLWLSVLGSTLFLIADSFWQYYAHTDIFGRMALPLGEGGWRLTGPFQMPRVGITILWLMFPLVLPLLATRVWLGGLFAIAAVLAIYLSGERTALLLALLGGGLTFLLLKQARVHCLLFGVLALTAAALFAYQNPAVSARQLQSVQQVITRIGESTYGQAWQSALRLGTEHPWAGVGRKQFQPNCRALPGGAIDQASIDVRCPMHAHNIYFEWLVEYGVPGLLMFLLFAFQLYRAAPAQWWQHPLQLGLMITLILRFWPLAATPSQFVVWSAGPFWLVVGWLFSYAPLRKRGPET